MTNDNESLRIEEAIQTLAGASDGFYRVLAEAAELHHRKMKDYGTDEDPYQNIRASTDFGIPEWVGVSLRMNDKEFRIKKFANESIHDPDFRLANESVRDSMIDNVVYGAIRVVVYDEETE